jgi:hypothetical protein
VFQARLEKIRTEVDPDEICPVIPFPSRDRRRGDGLIEEYRQLLFDDYRVEPANIIYASEYNPFEAYRQLFGVIVRYRDALRELGGCKVYVSPLSSKLLSVGALLACYDHRAQAAGQDPDERRDSIRRICYLWRTCRSGSVTAYALLALD